MVEKRDEDECSLCLCECNINGYCQMKQELGVNMVCTAAQDADLIDENVYKGFK